MGNGMPISAVVGRADIMSWMEKIFFSGTFGGETLSLAASLATIDKLERENAIPRITAVGRRLGQGVAEILEAHGLGMRYAVGGADWWPRVVANDGSEVSGVVATSLLRQELIANGLLMGRSLNLCLAHDDPAIVVETLERWGRAAAAVADAFASNDPAARLRGAPIEPVFRVRPD
jgi:glutamate-1-semialdehyde aminotransferase